MPMKMMLIVRMALLKLKMSGKVLAKCFADDGDDYRNNVGIVGLERGSWVLQDSPN